MGRNWSEIPEELVHMVAERLVCVDDFVRFGGVCKPWRSVFSVVKKEKKQVFAPVIMLAKAENDNLPTTEDEDEVKGIRSFLIPCGEKNKMRSFNVELPKAQGRRCWGSPYGWVVTVGLDYKMHLLNPLTGVQIPLPQHPWLERHRKSMLSCGDPPDQSVRSYTREFVLGWNSSSQELIVIAIFAQVSYGTFSFCIVPGNEVEAAASSSWRMVECENEQIYTHSVTFFNDKIFVLDGLGDGCFCMCDINQTPPKAIQIAKPPQDLKVLSATVYLVEIAGHLHLVARSFDCFPHYRFETKCFRVYRFNFGENEWYHVPDLGEYALFVGNHTPFAISTTTYPHFSPNFIYFSDDHFVGYGTSYCSMGVFDYTEGTIEPFDFTNHGAFSTFSRPTVFMPAL